MRGSMDRLWTVAVLVAGVSLGIVWLESSAWAQEGSAPSATPSAKEVLGEMVGIRAAGNDDAVAIQKSIDDVSDQTSDLLAKYRTTVKQIDAIDLYNAQMIKMIEAQEKELASLHDQVDRVQEVSRSVTPLMIRMIAALKKFVELDVPFLIKERTERVVALESVMGRADVTTSEKFRQIMEAYQIETDYGRTIEAYRGPLVIGDSDTTVDFLRFGRIALVYLSLDESEAGVWSQETHSWQPIESNLRSSIRDGLRIARKQSAPDLIKLPIPAAKDARGEI